MMPVPAGAARKRHLAGAVAAGDVVMQRAAFAQRHPRQVALRRVGRLADRLGHLARLAVAEADAALLVADDDQRRETEAPAALDDLGDAVDVDELVDELAVALFAIPIPISSAAFPFTCHGVFRSFSRGYRPDVIPLKVQSTFTRGIGQRLDAAVIEILAAIEHDILDAAS